MKRIISAENPLVKTLRVLGSDPGAVKRLGQVWLEGVHLVQAALDSGHHADTLVTTDDGLLLPEVAALVERVGSTNAVILHRALFSWISTLENGPQVGMLIAKPKGVKPRPGSAVVLDRIQDAGNVGTILRTAAAAECGAVYLLRGTAGAWTPKVLRAGMGAHFYVPIFEDAPWEQVAAIVPRPIYATAAMADMGLYDLQLKKPVTWVFGNEGQGISEHLMAKASAAVRIPQASTVESLNVASAAAICLFEGVRQRQANGK
ncbi:MAG: RNA methyltransferase [Betaproteobacteria bacterium]|nr:RNA methyltransferase [Betaproteobacteria bacterium]